MEIGALSLTVLLRLAGSAALAQRRESRLSGRIRTDIGGAFDIEAFGQMGAGAVDTALDGADRHAADLGGILIGEAGSTHEDQRLALVVGKLLQSGFEVYHIEMTVLSRMGGESS